MSDNFKEICAHFGLAYYMSNVLEHGIVNALFAIEFLERRSDYNTIKKWHVAVDTYYDFNFTKTLGALKKSLSRHQNSLVLLEDVLPHLDKCLHSRNYLAHQFWRIEYSASISNENTHRVIGELERIRDHFKDTDNKLEELIWPLLNANGITKELARDYMQAEIAMHREADRDSSV